MTKPSKISKRNPNILDSLTPDQALAVLELLAKDKDIKNKVEQIAKSYLAQVDVEETAKEVFMSLEALDVHDVWDDAGPNHYGGYQEPGEVAWDMAEGAIEPYLEQLKTYIQLKMLVQAKEYCRGIVRGIRDYQQKSKSEFKDWAGEDAFSEGINRVIDVWSESCKDPKEIKKMEEL